MFSPIIIFLVSSIAINIATCQEEQATYTSDELRTACSCLDGRDLRQSCSCPTKHMTYYDTPRMDCLCGNRQEPCICSKDITDSTKPIITKTSISQEPNTDMFVRRRKLWQASNNYAEPIAERREQAPSDDLKKSCACTDGSDPRKSCSCPTKRMRYYTTPKMDCLCANGQEPCICSNDIADLTKPMIKKTSISQEPNTSMFLHKLWQPSNNDAEPIAIFFLRIEE